MKSSQVFKFESGSQEIKIESYSDGSMWSALGIYGLNRNGIITAEYVNGKLRFSVIKNRYGKDSVQNKALVSDFKKFVKSKFKEIDAEWHNSHNALYGIK